MTTLTCPECRTPTPIDEDGDAICPGCDYVLTAGPPTKQTRDSEEVEPGSWQAVQKHVNERPVAPTQRTAWSSKKKRNVAIGFMAALFAVLLIIQANTPMSAKDYQGKIQDEVLPRMDSANDAMLAGTGRFNAGDYSGAVGRFRDAQKDFLSAASQVEHLRPPGQHASSHALLHGVLDASYWSAKQFVACADSAGLAPECDAAETGFSEATRRVKEWSAAFQAELHG